MKKLNISKEHFNESKYFIKKYGELEYVSESGKIYKTTSGNILKFMIEYDDVNSNYNIVERDGGYTLYVNGNEAGFMELTFKYGDSIINEIQDSIGYDYELNGIDPDQKSVYIEDFCVNKNYRRMGYAKLMMKKLIEDYGNRQLILRAFDTNGESTEEMLVRLYSKFGFTVVVNTDSDGVVMVRNQDY